MIIYLDKLQTSLTDYYYQYYIYFRVKHAVVFSLLRRIGSQPIPTKRSPNMHNRVISPDPVPLRFQLPGRQRQSIPLSCLKLTNYILIVSDFAGPLKQNLFLLLFRPPIAFFLIPWRSSPFPVCSSFLYSPSCIPSVHAKYSMIAWKSDFKRDWNRERKLLKKRLLESLTWVFFKGKLNHVDIKFDFYSRFVTW